MSLLSYFLGRFLPKLGGALCAAFFLLRAPWFGMRTNARFTLKVHPHVIAI
jgi:hypothetical protein